MLLVGVAFILPIALFVAGFEDNPAQRFKYIVSLMAATVFAIMSPVWPIGLGDNQIGLIEWAGDSPFRRGVLLVWAVMFPASLMAAIYGYKRGERG